MPTPTTKCIVSIPMIWLFLIKTVSKFGHQLFAMVHFHPRILFIIWRPFFLSKIVNSKYYNKIVFFFQKEDITFHPLGIFRYHRSWMFTFLFTFLFTWKMAEDLNFSFSQIWVKFDGFMTCFLKFGLCVFIFKNWFKILKFLMRPEKCI